MFIKSKYGGYDRDGQQSAGGLFLILMVVKNGDFKAVRAIVRYARLKQLGHFMMGSVRIGSERVTLSGAYGHDGLTCDVEQATWERGVPLPPELYEKWNTGGGHNSAGSEAEAMRKWALDNLTALYKTKRR